MGDIESLMLGAIDIGFAIYLLYMSKAGYEHNFEYSIFGVVIFFIGGLLTIKGFGR